MPVSSDAPSAAPDAGGWPPAAAIMARAQTENFTVASRILPAAVREHLLAVYGFARLVDELGDELAADRVAALDWLEAELDCAFAGRATHPLMVRLSRSISACRLPRDPFLRLIEANRRDQRASRYERFEDLLGYCELSANPVGELVLHVLGVATSARVALSDSICSALQLAEHFQDVGEDFSRGRIYLPLEDMRRFRVGEQELAGTHTSPALRSLLAFEVARARELLREGLPLLASVRGRMRFALAGYVAGGFAALEAIERADYDVLAGPRRAGAARRALALARVLTARQGGGSGGAHAPLDSRAGAR